MCCLIFRFNFDIHSDVQTLEDLLVSRRGFTDPLGTSDDLYFVTPLHQNIKLRTIDTRYGPPKQDLTEIQPFSDWSVQECYSFYKNWLQNPTDDTNGNFSAFTFLILDSETLSAGPTHHSVILCTDAPDISDIPKRRDSTDKTPVLKFRRLTFWAAAHTMDTWEMMTGMFSDLGQDEQLSFHAESWRKHVSFTEDGGEVTRFVTPGEARARQEKLLEDYIAGNREVDMT